MTAPTAARPSAPTSSGTPETLLGGVERRSDAAVLRWLMRVRQADLSHPWVRRWTMPVICALFAVPAVQQAADGASPGLPWMLVLTAVLCLPLLWRCRRPILTFAITSAASLVVLALDTATGAEAARVAALLNVGRSARPVQLAVCVAVAITQTSVAAFAQNQSHTTGMQTAVVAIVQALLVAAVAAAGVVGRVVNAYVVALKERAARLEVERDQRARLAAATERSRVAREMHDILGHTLAVIVGLANGAAGLTTTKPERGAQALRIIADSGRGALAELRRLLAVVGDEKATSADAPLAPQPGLDDLDALLERVRAAGPAVTLHTEGSPAGLPPGLQLAVYRVVQEALTNTLKYAAPTTSVRITITVDEAAVDLTIEDTGPSLAPGDDTESRGLVGMRERAALYGGGVTAGFNDRGGWTVRAHFLLATAPAPTEKRLV
ncbi:sensor histidine kinase [Streptomyces silvensis]|uniref:histidine kinase n=1 Tax=Streptomyces silvensis TaxID=1765722 RepID=A0A0W7X5L2_9ACTN|nr:histidine kinase [Streptomyces silvensis]KUF18159.1 histidine kinase [Streptomyces silvensis]